MVDVDTLRRAEADRRSMAQVSTGQVEQGTANGRTSPAEASGAYRALRDRHPKELAHILQRAGAVWEPGSHRPSQRPRIGPVNRALERATDPLFRRTGLNLDHK
jgi:hypothetical protein